MLGLSRTDGLLQFPLSCNVLIVDHLCALSPISEVAAMYSSTVS